MAEKSAKLMEEFCLASPKPKQNVWLKFADNFDVPGVFALLNMVAGKQFTMPKKTSVVSIYLEDLFPLAMLEIVEAVAFTSKESYNVTSNNFERAIAFKHLFTNCDYVTFRFFRDPFSFKASSSELKVEAAARAAHRSLVEFATAISRHELKVAANLNLTVDGEPFNPDDQNLKRLVLLMARFQGQFCVDDFCRAYDRKSAEPAKEGHRHLKRLKKVFPALSWKSDNKHNRVFDGVDVKFEEDPKEILALIEENLRA